MPDTRRMHLKPTSRAVHAGERPAPRDFVPTATPIYATSSFVYQDIEQMDAALGGATGVFVYGRYGNPTLEAMETAVAALEETDAALGVASGMAAVNLPILATAPRGGRVVASRDVYGATVKLLDQIYRDLGIETVFVDILDLDAVRAGLARGDVRAVVCETISNPLLRVTDIPAVAKLAHAVGAALIVDNTFATPWLVRPAGLGADYVVHSSTKYLGGHGDVTAGVIASDAERRLQLNELNKAVGSVLSPFDAWLILRGIKTLPLRLVRQSENALTVARWLAEQPKVARVFYPGLPGHESHQTANRLFPDGLYGAMVSFEMHDCDRAAVVRFLGALEMIVPATTLGDVFSLVLYPVMSSHRALTPEQRETVGIGESLVRLSVGIEDPADVIADLERALSVV
ncbi:MAG TPA: PLP-dependent aspartate aminotransferase family protein [Nitrolancea sp.]|nr:PLP-dependent aspartate aminotransferase family protein [Nitrolancea sp.]